MRRLICKNKKSVEKYNSYAIELFRFYNINKKLDNIKRNQHIIDNDMRVVKIDLLDEQVIDILLNAKKKYRKLRTGEVDYLPEISRVAEIQYMQRVALKVAKGQSYYKREAISLSKRMSIDLGDLSNIDEIQLKVVESKRVYLQLRT